MRWSQSKMDQSMQGHATTAHSRALSLSLCVCVCVCEPLRIRTHSSSGRRGFYFHSLAAAAAEHVFAVVVVMMDEIFKLFEEYVHRSLFQKYMLRKIILIYSFLCTWRNCLRTFLFLLLSSSIHVYCDAACCQILWLLLYLCKVLQNCLKQLELSSNYMFFNLQL